VVWISANGFACWWFCSALVRFTEEYTSADDPPLARRLPTASITGSLQSLDISKPPLLVREIPLLPRCPCPDVSGSDSRNTSLSSNIFLNSGLESNLSGDTEQNVSCAKEGPACPANVCLSASFRYSPTMNRAIRRPALSLKTVVRSKGLSLWVEMLVKGAWEDMLVAAREDLEVWSCGGRSPRPRRPDVKACSLAFNVLRRLGVERAGGGSARGGRPTQQNRAMRCDGGSAGEAGGGGWQSQQLCASPTVSNDRRHRFESGLLRFGRGCVR
jgi:hypothetical protein